LVAHVPLAIVIVAATILFPCRELHPRRPVDPHAKADRSTSLLVTCVGEGNRLNRSH
jgi:hypothetical protein